MLAAVSACVLFNLMNRLVEGLGIQAGDDYFPLASEQLSQRGYTGPAKLLQW